MFKKSKKIVRSDSETSLTEEERAALVGQYPQIYKSLHDIGTKKIGSSPKDAINLTSE
jgi:hypothetical protein